MFSNRLSTLAQIMKKPHEADIQDFRSTGIGSHESSLHSLLMLPIKPKCFRKGLISCLDYAYGIVDQDKRSKYDVMYTHIQRIFKKK